MKTLQPGEIAKVGNKSLYLALADDLDNLMAQMLDLRKKCLVAAESADIIVPDNATNTGVPSWK